MKIYPFAIYIALCLMASIANAQDPISGICGNDITNKPGFQDDMRLNRLYEKAVVGMDLKSLKDLLVKVQLQESTDRLVYKFNYLHESETKKDWKAVFVLKNGKLASKHLEYTGYVFEGKVSDSPP